MELTKLNEPLRFLVRCSLFAVLVYGSTLFLPVEKLTSDATAEVLNFFGIKAATYEEYGRIYLEYLQISIDCTAMEVLALFLGLILATRAVLKKKIIFSVFGTLAVLLANILRISSVYYLLERGIPWYLAHDLFSGTLAVLAGMLFLLVSEKYMPEINENLYSLLDAFESLMIRRR